MDEFIKLLDPSYELIQYRIKENKVIFHIASTIAELECPFCGRKTSKVHSIYEREEKWLWQDIRLSRLHLRCTVPIDTASSFRIEFSLLCQGGYVNKYQRNAKKPPTLKIK